MLKITVTARGKVIKFEGSETMRTPRIFYKDEKFRPEIEAKFRVLCLSTPADYIIETVSEDDAPINLDSLYSQPYSRVKNDHCDIQVGGKIGKKH